MRAPSEEPAPQVPAELVGPERMGELGGWALARGFSALGSAGARRGASAAADSSRPTAGPAIRSWRDAARPPVARGPAGDASAALRLAAGLGGRAGARCSAMPDPRVERVRSRGR